MEQPEETFLIAFDKQKLRPGCINIQAVLAGHRLARKRFMDLFPSETWEVNIAGVKTYTVTAKDMEQMAALTEVAHRHPELLPDLQELLAGKPPSKELLNRVRSTILA